MSLSSTAYADSLVTFIFAYLSLFGSILVLISYIVARSKSTPRIANLILHLAASDFFWFLSAGIQSSYWLFSPNNAVPDGACFVLSPLLIFTRMASLAWTCVISFNVLMSVEKRKWLWQGGDQSWTQYHQRYYVVIFLLAAPGTILTLVKQHSNEDTSDLGCSPDYEALGVWYEVFFPEVLPILLGFLCNVYVFLNVYGRMSRTAYPQSVRKRRKRIMYHYIIVCIVCWVPTVLNYAIELIGYHNTVVEILARGCLYSSGFLNFLVFGMQDPHLKRSFKLILYYSGLSSFCECFLPTSYLSYYSPLKATDVEKNVMFQEETIVSNADLPKDKRSVYRNRKLSKADRMHLYTQRPDLDLRSPPTDANAAVQSGIDGSSRAPKSAMKGARAAAISAATSAPGEVGNGNDNGVSGRQPLCAARADLAHSGVNCGEEVASMIHTNVAAAMMTGPITADTDAVAAGQRGGEARTRRPSRTRSSSFHSGASAESIADLRTPLLGEEHKQLSGAAACSYPQSSPYTAAGFSVPSFLSGRPGNQKELPRTTPSPMDMVGAGLRSSSTERILVPCGSGVANPADIEQGHVSASPVGRELVQLHSGAEKEWDIRRQLDSSDVSTTLTNDSGDLSSSDDDSDEEDKELNIPIR